MIRQQRLMGILAERRAVRVDEIAEELHATRRTVYRDLIVLAGAVPESGLVISEHAGGDRRPVGRRPIVLLEALP